MAGWWVRCLRCVPIRSGLFSVELSIVGECKISFDPLDLYLRMIMVFLAAKTMIIHISGRENIDRTFKKKIKLCESFQPGFGC